MRLINAITHSSIKVFPLGFNIETIIMIHASLMKKRKVSVLLLWTNLQ